jgi:hypothetical protein
VTNASEFCYDVFPIGHTILLPDNDVVRWPSSHISLIIETHTLSETSDFCTRVDVPGLRGNLINVTHQTLFHWLCRSSERRCRLVRMPSSSAGFGFRPCPEIWVSCLKTSIISTAALEKCRDNASNQTTAASYHIIFNLLCSNNS